MYQKQVGVRVWIMQQLMLPLPNVATLYCQKCRPSLDLACIGTGLVWTLALLQPPQREKNANVMQER